MEYEKIKPEGSSYLHVAIDISFEIFMSCENFTGNQLHVLVVENCLFWAKEKAKSRRIIMSVSAFLEDV